LLTLILAESAIETIPEYLWSHSAVRRHSKKQRKPPKQLLLDRSLHHSAMRQLNDNLKRGRPDITHFALLEALGSPLNKERLLQTYVHTNKDYIITVNPNTRLPKNYNRFIGLMEQLFQQQKVPLDGKTLLKLEPKTLQQLLAEAKADYVLAFSRKGKPKTMHEAISGLHSKHRPVLIIGGFPSGHLSKTSINLADEVVCVDSEMLEAWTIVSRAIYEYERVVSLPIKRLRES
jgi:rRNA small subunit pseudouridine methyltransferase Nep1